VKPEKRKLQIIDKANKRARKLKPQCFFSSCSESAVKSHSQSKRSLNNISVGGKVIGISRPYFSPPQYVDDWFKEISIGQASLFKGFCGKHDNEFFKSVDDFELTSLDKETLAKLAFRTFAMEIRRKQQASCVLSTIIRESEGMFHIPEDPRLLCEGIKIFLEKDYPYYLNRFETIFDSDNYDDVESAVFLLPRNIGISCSTVINPIDEEIGDIQPLMSFTVLPNSDATTVLFTYFLSDKQAVMNFIGAHDKLEDIVFNRCEEVLFNPALFRSLTDNDKRTITKGLAHWMSWEKVQCPDLLGVNLTSPDYY